MTPEHDRQLCEKYPKLYAGRNKRNPMETLMCFGFECGEGWFALIDKLSAKLEKLNDTKDAQIEAMPVKEKEKFKEEIGSLRIEAMQVKEKFGGLRFYIGSYPAEFEKEIRTAIDEAEEESYKTCESCGKPGEPNDRGWISTLCPECRKSIEAEREKNLRQMQENLDKMAKKAKEIDKEQEKQSRDN